MANAFAERRKRWLAWAVFLVPNSHDDCVGDDRGLAIHGASVKSSSRSTAYSTIYCVLSEDRLDDLIPEPVTAASTCAAAGS
jgi:hypothetical protein